MRLAGLLILLILICTACGPDVTYSHRQDFPAGGWAYADSVDFAFPVTDTTAAYDMVLTVTHGTDFPAQNFYVHLTTRLPDGTVLRQPLSLQLADKFGGWYGDCSADHCDTDISIQVGTRFTRTGDHHLVISQFSREDPLPEVEALAFRLIRRD